MNQGFDRTLHGLEADFWVLEFAVAILQEQLHLVAVIQEVFGAADLDKKVMHIDTWAEFDLLDLGRGLLVLMLLRFFVEVLAVLHEFAHRGRGRRRNLDEVDAEFTGQLECLGGLHDAKHFAFGRDDANLGRTDAVVTLGSFILPAAEVSALLTRATGGGTRPGAVRAIGRWH